VAAISIPAVRTTGASHTSLQVGKRELGKHPSAGLVGVYACYFALFVASSETVEPRIFARDPLPIEFNINQNIVFRSLVERVADNKSRSRHSLATPPTTICASIFSPLFVLAIVPPLCPQGCESRMRARAQIISAVRGASLRARVQIPRRGESRASSARDVGKWW
jgi:hypothetical protein